MITYLDLISILLLIVLYTAADGLILWFNAKKQTEVNMKRELLKLSFFLYCIVLLRLTEFSRLWFLGIGHDQTAAVNIIPFKIITDEIRFVFDHGVSLRVINNNLFGNILLFMPMGLLAPAIWPVLQRLWKCLLLGMLVSLGIEAAQFLLTSVGVINRMADIDDVILNSMGTLAGYGVYALILWLRNKRLDEPGEISRFP